MTKIVGTIRDVHLAGAASTLTIWSGFRATTVSVIAPRRRVWEVENGVLPDGIVVAPGPAVIQIDAGVSAFKSWPVEVPDQDEVTIQELLFQTVPWEPGTALPPPEEVGDLLRLIADTSEQYRLALLHDADRALDQIALSVAMAQAVEVSGQGYSTAAQEHMAAALRYALDSLAAAQEASDKADEARGSLTATELLRAEAESVREQIETLAGQVAGSASEVDLSTAEGLAAAAEAARQAGIAEQLAGQAQSIREQIERHMEAAQAAVAEGERQVAWAMERAAEAHQAAAEAEGHADNAQGIVAGAQAALDSTQDARDEAQQSLEAIQGIGTAVDLIQTQVLSLHGDTIAAHAEVLSAHGEAIDAAAAAAASAGEAAGLATDTAVHATNAANEALAASQANAEAQATFSAQQEQFNEDYSERTQLQAMMLEAVREAQAAALFERWHIATADGTSAGGDDMVSIASGRAASVTALGSWVGRMVIHAQWGGSYTSSEYSDSYYPSRLREYPIPNEGSRTVLLGDVAGTRRFVRVDYTVDPGEQIVDDRPGGAMELAAQDTWYEVPGSRFTVPANIGSLAMTFDVGWDNASFIPSYRHRIRVAGGAELALYDKHNIGPIFGGDYRKRSVFVSGVALQPGQEVVFEVNSNANGQNYRKVRDTFVHITYVRFA